jgi:hypothetical protein
MPPLHTIKHIGPYLAGRFQTASFWPPGSNHLYPIHTTNQLVNFVRTRTGNPQQTRKRLVAWLNEVLANPRADQCVGNDRRHAFQIYNGRGHRYRVRRTNQMGFNAVVHYLRNQFPPGSAVRARIPSARGSRPVRQAYPPACAT